MSFLGKEVGHALGPRVPRVAQGPADDVPGPLLVAQPADARARDPPRAARGPEARDQGASRTRGWTTSCAPSGWTLVAASRYPHEFSGGQRQRIGLARALALNPKLIVADEPVSALDVSIQAQILNLMRELQRDRGITYVMVSHDLAVVYYMSDSIGVMYLGKIVELGDAESVFRTPAHPYTQGLLDAVPIPDPDEARARAGHTIGGELPSPADPPSGCRFRTRCPRAQDRCRSRSPSTGRSGRGTPRRATSRCARPSPWGSATARGPAD